MDQNNKFSEVIENRIKLKADKNYDIFWKDFENFLAKYHLSRDVIFKGLQGVYSKKEDNRSEYINRVKEVFIQAETEKFLSEINRLENYFNNNGQY